MAFPAHANATEKRIIAAIIKRALAAGYMVSVHDGQEWTVSRSTDYEVITADVHATDETRLMMRRANGDKVGTVYLVHGNEDDVICDHTDNDATEALVKGL